MSVHRRWLGAVALLAASGPVLASLVRLTPGWVPAGDVAILAVRSGDVLSRHLPLLGMPSTAGDDGTQVFHPGPLQLWATGLVRAVWDAPAAPLVVAGVVALGSTAVAVLLVRRLLGPGAGAVAAGALALLGWSLRGEVLASPFNPHVALLPFCAYLVALVAAHEQVRGASVVAVALGSWAAQAHLAFAGPVAATAAATVLLGGRRRGWGRLWAKPAWPVWALLAACWSGPIADVVLHRGGNVRAVTGREGGETLGLGRSVEVLVQALGPRPAPVQAGAGPLTLLASPAVASWLVAAAVLAGLAVVAVRARGETAGASAAVVLVGLAVTTLLLGQVSDLTYNALALHNYLPLWPLVLGAWSVVLVELARWAGRRWGRPRAGPAALTTVGVGAALVLTILSAIDLHRPTGEAERDRGAAVSQLVVGALGDLDRVAVHVDPYFEPFAVQTAVIAHLDRLGVSVAVPVDQAAGFGDHRVADGSAPTLWISVDHPEAGEGGEVIARTTFRRSDGTTAEVVATLLPPSAPGGDGTLTAP